jgi:hypothetical protein
MTTIHHATQNEALQAARRGRYRARPVPVLAHYYYDDDMADTADDMADLMPAIYDALATRQAAECWS